MTHHATEIMEMWQEGKWESLPESLKDKRLLFLVARHERNERLIRHICIKTLNEQNCSLLLIQGTNSIDPVCSSESVDGCPGVSRLGICDR
jgi:hypothetical protein